MTGNVSHQASYAIRDVRREDIAALASWIPQDDEPFRHQWLISQQTAGNLDCIAAWIKGLPVGQGIILWGGYVIPELAAEFPCTPVIRSVKVIERYRGRGIGNAIVAELEARARMRGFAYASLGVMPGNTHAESLWRHLGYTDWGKGLFNTTSIYESANGKELIRAECFLPMRKRLV